MFVNTRVNAPSTISNSFQKAFVCEISGLFKLISRRENRPIPFLK